MQMPGARPQTGADDEDVIEEDENLEPGEGEGEGEGQGEPEGGAEASAEEEAKARRMGWVPESEWKSDRGGRKPARFLSAKEFLDKVDNDIPVLRERLRKTDEANVALTGQVKELHTKLDETSTLVKDLHEQNKLVAKRARERALAEAQAERDRAIEEADKAAVREADKKIRELEDEERTAAGPKAGDDDEGERRPKPGPESKGDGGLSPEAKSVIDGWVEEEQWFAKDPELNAIFTSIQGRIAKSNPRMSLRETLDEATAEIKDRFADRFEPEQNPRRQAASAVRRPTGGAGGRGGGKTFADLPADARDSFKRMQRFFKEKGQDYTEAQYLKDYEW